MSFDSKAFCRRSENELSQNISDMPFSDIQSAIVKHVAVIALL